MKELQLRSWICTGADALEVVQWKREIHRQDQGIEEWSSRASIDQVRRSEAAKMGEKENARERDTGEPMSRKEVSVGKARICTPTGTMLFERRGFA